MEIAVKEHILVRVDILPAEPHTAVAPHIAGVPVAEEDIRERNTAALPDHMAELFPEEASGSVVPRVAAVAVEASAAASAAEPLQAAADRLAADRELPPRFHTPVALAPHIAAGEEASLAAAEKGIGNRPVLPAEAALPLMQEQRRVTSGNIFYSDYQ